MRPDHPYRKSVQPFTKCTINHPSRSARAAYETRYTSPYTLHPTLRVGLQETGLFGVVVWWLMGPRQTGLLLFHAVDSAFGNLKKTHSSL